MRMLADAKGTRKALVFSSNIGIFLAFVFLIVCGALLSPVFLTIENLQTIAVQTSISAVVAVGMTFVIISWRDRLVRRLRSSIFFYGSGNDD